MRVYYGPCIVFLIDLKDTYMRSLWERDGRVAMFRTGESSGSIMRALLVRCGSTSNVDVTTLSSDQVVSAAVICLKVVLAV